MKGALFSCLLSLLISAGCTQKSWLAQIYVVKAEEAFLKGYELRVKKGIPYERRLEYYRKACTHFRRAQDMDPAVFTLNRIVSAVEACRRVKDYESESQFREFEERYAIEHPNEVKYGDAGAWMTLE